MAASQLSKVDINNVELLNTLKSSLCGAVIVTGKIPKIVFANKVFTEIFGYSAKDLLNFSALQTYKLIAAEDRKMFWQRYQDRLSGKKVPAHYEFKGVNKSGSIRVIDILAKRVTFKGEPAIQADFLDVTITRELHDGRAMYQKLFDTSRDAIITLAPPSWKFMAANAITVALFGAKSKADFLTYAPWQLSPNFQPDGQKSVVKAKKMILLAMANGSNLFEWTHKKVNGQEFLAEVFLSKVNLGKVSFLQAVVRDISADKKEKEALKQYRFIIDQATEQIAVTTKTGEVVFVNDAWANGHGYKKEALVGKKISIFHPLSEQKKVKANVELIRREGKAVDEIVHMRKDGSTFPTLMNNFMLEFDGKNYLVGMATDISAQKQIEDSFKSEHALLTETAKLSQVGGWKLNVVNSVLTWTDAVYDIHEVSKKTFTPTVSKAINFYTASSKPIITKAIQAAVKKGKSFDLELEIITAKGNLRWVRAIGGAFQGVIQGVFQDVTGQKMIQKALEEREIKYRRLFECAQDGILIINSKDGTIIDSNPFLQQLIGYSAKELIGKRVFEISMFKDKALNKASFLKLKRERYVRYEDLPLKSKSGKVVHVEFVSNVYNANDINSESIIQCNIRDISERFLFDKKLKDSEERFRGSFDHSAVGLALVAPDGHWLHANKAICDMLGYTAKEMATTTYKAITHPDDVAKTMALTKKLLSGKGHFGYLEKRYITKSGKIIWVYLNVTAIYGEDKKVSYFVTQVQNITKEREAKIALAELAEKYSLATNVSGQVFYEYDINTRLIQWFGPIKKVLGYAPEEFAKVDIHKLVQLIHPKDRSRVIRVLQKAQKNIAHYICEYRFKYKGDGYLDIYDEGAFFKDGNTGKIRMLGSMHDISVLKNKEKIILENEAKDEALLGAISDGVVAIDRDDRIIYINMAAAELLKIGIKSSLGKLYYQLWDVCDAKGVILKLQTRPIYRASKSSQKIVTSFQDDLYYKLKDGTIFPVGLVANPVFIKGVMVGVVNVFKNVLSEKEVDRMKSDFVSLASHQLRTPITGINWTTEALLGDNGGELTVAQRKMIEDIRFSNKRMIVLVNALLNVARLEMGTFIVEPHRLKLENVCRDVLRAVSEQIEMKQIKIKTSCPRSLKGYMGDPRIMSIIFENLISNAIKYSKEKGEVSLSGSITKKELIISVKDNGIGIPKSQQPKIFTKLFRADNARIQNPDGTGLGLYIVRLILSSLGGRVWFKSKEKKGTTFYVSLPIKGMKKKAGSRPLI